MAAARLAEGLFLSYEQAAAGATIRWEPSLPPTAAEPPSSSAGTTAAMETATGDNHQRAEEEGVVEAGLRERWGSGLVSELRHASPTGRVCGLKGLATALPLSALCAPLRLRERPGEEAGWSRRGAGSEWGREGGREGGGRVVSSAHQRRFMGFVCLFRLCIFLLGGGR